MKNVIIIMLHVCVATKQIAVELAQCRVAQTQRHQAPAQAQAQAHLMASQKKGRISKGHS